MIIVNMYRGLWVVEYDEGLWWIMMDSHNNNNVSWIVEYGGF